MSTLKGQISSDSNTTKDVTVSQDGNKVSLDVAVSPSSSSTGTGSGLELEGSNSLASGSLLYLSLIHI